MKLLDKFETQKAKAFDRKREIDEGVKLAKKVDVLRETLAKEQANLIAFRDKSVADIREEIARLIAERDKVQNEIVTLVSGQDKQRALLEAEKKQLKSEREELALAKASVQETLDSLKQTEVSSLKRVKEIQLEAERVEDLKHTAMISLKNSESIKIETRSLFVEAQLYYDKTVEDCTEAMRELETQKRELDYKKVDLDNREKSLAKRETQLSKDQLILKDREGVLQRNIKRLN